MENLAFRCGDDKTRRGDGAIEPVLDPRRQRWTRLAEVSRLHRASRYSIWNHEIARAIFWGGLFPLMICLGALVYPAVLWCALAYPLQICRVAIARKPASPRSWVYALFVTFTKFAEFQGIVKFYWRQIWRRDATLIEYK